MCSRPNLVIADRSTVPEKWLKLMVTLCSERRFVAYDCDLKNNLESKYYYVLFLFFVSEFLALGKFNEDSNLV